jgi:hypothetical protein
VLGYQTKTLKDARFLEAALTTVDMLGFIQYD